MLAGKAATTLLVLTMLGTAVVASRAERAAAAPSTGLDQRGVIAAADAVSSAVREARTSGGSGSGLAGISADPGRGHVLVYWKGEVPAAVRDTVAAQGGKIIPAVYSEHELLEAAHRVVSAQGAHRAGDGQIAEIGPLPDGSGLSASVTGHSADVPALSKAGVRVSVTTGARLMTLAGRQVDASPYSSGATFHWDNAGLTYRCTTGIPVLHNGSRKMLTAGHCGSNGLSIKRSDGVAWGTVNNDVNGRDTMLISPGRSVSISSSIYHGTHSSNLKKPINGAALDSYVDTLVCTSGAKTGEHCNIRIKQKNVTISVAGLDGIVYPIFPMVKAEHDNHTVAVGQGDSGGPVVAMDSMGPAPFFPGDFVNVYPMGTISAIDTNTSVPCGSVDGGPTTCAWRMYYAGILDSLAFYGATAVKA